MIADYRYSESAACANRRKEIEASASRLRDGASDLSISLSRSRGAGRARVGAVAVNIRRQVPAYSFLADVHGGAAGAEIMAEDFAETRSPISLARVLRLSRSFVGSSLSLSLSLSLGAAPSSSWMFPLYLALLLFHVACYHA